MFALAVTRNGRIDYLYAQIFPTVRDALDQISQRSGRTIDIVIVEVSRVELHGDPDSAGL